MPTFFDAFQQPGTCLFGTWAKLNSPETLEMLAQAGFDFVVIDTEHAPHTYETTYRAIVLAQSLGMRALVRLPDQVNQDVQRVLDSGADGVLVPRVRNADEARRVIDGMIFSPEGSRGLGITSRAGRWGLATKDEYVNAGNQGVARALQLEDPEALENCEAILDVPGVNAIFVGLGDLALVTGKPGNHPDNDALVQKLLDAAKAVGDPAAALRAKERGFSFVMVSNDLTMFAKAALGAMKGLKD
jgi:2-keto-3-deoxy-L-rhamnonate aldolase RhmA